MQRSLPLMGLRGREGRCHFLIIGPQWLLTARYFVLFQALQTDVPPPPMGSIGRSERFQARARGVASPQTAQYFVPLSITRPSLLHLRMASLGQIAPCQRLARGRQSPGMDLFFARSLMPPTGPQRHPLAQRGRRALSRRQPIGSGLLGMDPYFVLLLRVAPVQPHRPTESPGRRALFLHQETGRRLPGTQQLRFSRCSPMAGLPTMQPPLLTESHGRCEHRPKKTEQFLSGRESGRTELIFVPWPVRQITQSRQPTVLRGPKEYYQAPAHGSVSLGMEPYFASFPKAAKRQHLLLEPPGRRGLFPAPVGRPSHGMARCFVLWEIMVLLQPLRPMESRGPRARFRA